MSSESDYQTDHAPQESSEESSKPPTRPSSRRQSRTPNTPRKRPRVESVDPSRIRKYYLEGKYNDAYRVLFNEDVSLAAVRFNADSGSNQHYITQFGSSVWSSKEQSTLFAALERLGRDDIPGISSAIGTKSIPETQEFMLLLQDAATRQGYAKVTLRDIPAAIEVGNECCEQLDIAGEALAWYQETFEASQEQERFGDYWLITPAIADKIEDTVAGRSRAVSSTPASEPEPPRRGGKVVVGYVAMPAMETTLTFLRRSCTSCKQFKQKCDRGTPCGNCVRRKIGACVYKEKPTRSEKENLQGSTTLASEAEEIVSARVPARPNRNLLEAIPEAHLLQPAVMLSLSKNLFMNRSPTIPSPWPHWFEYTSELAEEPSIYRSAFNDFHTLAVSVTKRLAQTALIQATSRLRSQRRRFKKGVLPLVKKRDVLAAIDILGMKRNGKERWRTVARRCSVRVHEGRKDRRKEVSWDEVERIMKYAEASTEPLTTDAETSGNDTEAFNSRAARSGTPLPMEQLAISDSDEDIGTDDEYNESMAESDGSVLDEGRPPFTYSATQPRDPFRQYTGAPPASALHERKFDLGTLEQFDQEASRQEEQTLWEMLELEPPIQQEEMKNDDSDDEESLEDSGNLITDPDGWRTWSEYRAEWEEFRKAVPAAKFYVSEKPDSSITFARVKPSQGDSRRDTQPTSEVIELQARSTRAYAALQERTSEPNHQPEDSEEAWSEDAESDASADVPTQSIEDSTQAVDMAPSGSEMDWSA
ncbi:hypothetical protein N0V83_009031 [Neocucurbitaria cava]|uniref:Zn(2)-C6 fungal-type domain-containing protein n=1 Tax=Neocucurbitaria cava TaxID=798079 RepID=A0A9W8Y0S4_9PLEO|nr:hypothetical protein N0V83_009031 [Neocucurbitaria cava]